MPPAAVHQPFSWFGPKVPQSRDHLFVGVVYDICEGARTILHIEQRNSNKVQLNEQPLLNAEESDRLRLLAIAALGLLSDAAFERIEEINEASHEGEQA